MKKQLLLSAVLVFGLAAFSVQNSPTQQPSQAEEGVFINGARWATRNVDAPGTFAEKPESYGQLFQWNSRVGWASTDPKIAAYTAYTTLGYLPAPTTATEWEADNNPCPPGWRMPTNMEFENLMAAGSEWKTLNGVPGRLFGAAPNQIFLPAAIHIDELLEYHGYSIAGIYWAFDRFNEEMSYHFTILSNFLNMSVSGIGAAFSVRCVAED
jgi:uncharacterized protein (TIGR02145 family)